MTNLLIYTFALLGAWAFLSDVRTSLACWLTGDDFDRAKGRYLVERVAWRAAVSFVIALGIVRVTGGW